VKIIKSIMEMSDCISSIQNNDKVSLIPTMGNLHKGHLSLISHSKSYPSKIIVSIFINPLQFNDANDYKNYPTSLESDLNILQRQGVDYVFLPSRDEIIPTNNKNISLPVGFKTKLCGKFRPGHFEGVLIIVKQLINIIKPNYLFFGEKDYQQTLLIKFMLQKYFSEKKIKLITCPTVREASGLALSSRNNLLDNSFLNIASTLYRVMLQHKNNNSKLNWDRYNDIEIEYCEKFGLEELYDLHGISFSLDNDSHDQLNETRLFVSAYIQGIRLIDNIEIE